MPRISRMIISEEQAVYHVMSRTALPDFPLGDVEKEFWLGIIKRMSKLYSTAILGFCLMGNHLHLLVKMLLEGDFKEFVAHVALWSSHKMAKQRLFLSRRKIMTFSRSRCDLLTL